MVYDAKLHTKQWLLQNLNAAVDFANKSSDFIHGPAQDKEFLLAAHEEFEREESFDLMMALCKSDEWISTAVAQNKEIASLMLKGGAAPAASFMAKSPKWASSAIAQDKDILSLKSALSGLAVAHTLSFMSKEWGETPAAQELSILSIKSDSSMTSVAHMLAEFTPQWIYTPAAYRQDILNIKNDDGDCVFEYRISVEPDSNVNAELLTRNLKFGDAVFMKPKALLRFCGVAGAVDAFLSKALDEAEQLFDIDSKAQFIAALYSSLSNIKSTYYHIPEKPDVTAEITDSLSVAERELIDLIEKGADISRLLSGHGEYCDPARDVALKFINRTTFADVAQEQGPDEMTTPSAPGLY